MRRTLRGHWLWPSLFLLVSELSLASTESTCAAVTSGTLRGLPALYSECGVDVGATETYVVAMISTIDGVSLSVDGAPAEDFAPRPSAVTEIGKWDRATRYVQQMPADYEGNCSDIDSVDTNISAVDDQVYCGVLRVTSNDELLLRGRWNSGEASFSETRVTWVDSDGVRPALPVPIPSSFILPALVLIMSITGAAAAHRGRSKKGRSLFGINDSVKKWRRATCD